MNWLRAKVKFGSFFSYRVPDFSSQYALSSILPSPLAVKLAVIATAIQYKGKRYGMDIFEVIKDKNIGFKVEGKIVINNFLIRRLKKGRENNLESTFGIRGYVFYENPLEIWFEGLGTELKDVLVRLRYLGTSDSLCTLEIEEVSNTKNALIFPRKELDSSLSSSIIIPTKDLSPKDTFEKIDIYNSRKTVPRLEKKFFQIPVRLLEQSKNWIVYDVG